MMRKWLPGKNSGELDFTIVREGMVISKNELFNGDGIYYALIIGVSDYRDAQIADLDGLPIKDANRLSRVLMEKYIFDTEHVQLMENPTYTDILRAFDRLSRVVTNQDNLLIFYAGHEFYDERTELGYWLPALS